MIPIKSPTEFPGTAESAESAVSARRVVSRLLVQSGQAPEAPNRRAAMEALQLGCHEEMWSDGWHYIPSGCVKIANLKMTMGIVDFPIENGDLP